MVVENTQISITLGEDFTYDYFPVLAPIMTEGYSEKNECSFSSECLSKVCPHFIHYDQDKGHWYYKKTDSGKAGTYLIVLTYSCPD